MNPKLVHVYTAEGKLAAEMIRAFLESNGIEATVIQESIGGTYGLTVGPMGEVQVFVKEEQLDQTRSILAAMERGDYELPEEGEPAQINEDDSGQDPDEV